MKPELKVVVAIVAVITLSTYVYATEPSGASVSGETDYGEYNQPPAGSVNIIESGNITGVNLDGNMSTYRWAGLLGNVTGRIVLGDENNETMFEWTAAGRIVYASIASSITWSSLENSSSGDMPGYLTTSASDNYTSTFTGSGSLNSGIFSLTAERATTTSAEATNWYTYALKEGVDLVWAGDVEEDGTSYANNTVDYQIIIPEDGTSGDTSPSTYYLWVELI